MIMQDKMEKEKADAKNAVEEYVYEMRGKLSEELEKFISEEVTILVSTFQFSFLILSSVDEKCFDFRSFFIVALRNLLGV